MIAEKAVARGRIVARRSLQRFDKSEQRRQWRAQFMTDIGDEIGAHFLDAPQRREIVQRQHDELAATCRAAERNRNDMRLPPGIDRNTLGEFNALGLVFRRRPAHRSNQIGAAQRQ